MTAGSAGVRNVFEILGTAVTEALETRGFDSPTEPQQRAIEPIAAGDHTLVIAPTGTGKTETAMLPIFDAIVRGRNEDGLPFGFSTLYITPLRALNRDMRERLDWWGEELGLDIDVRHGDTTQYQRQQQAENPPDVLVTTPESLQAMLTGSKLRVALESVEHVVVDEVHELASSKRGAQLAVGLERLRILAGDYQRVGLSATVGDPDRVGRFLTGDRGCQVRQIDVGTHIDVSVRSPKVREEDTTLAGKLATEETIASHVRALIEEIEANDSTLVFVNTRQTVEALGSRLRSLDSVNVGVHHGSLSTQARLEVEDAFKSGTIDALLCTSSMELGLDVGRIDHVVQYQSPREVTRLLQRVGRAGHRADMTSSGTVIATRPDDTMEAMVIARRSAIEAVETAGIHEGTLDTLANQLIGLLMDLDEVSARDAYRVVTAAFPFRHLEPATFASVVNELSRNRLIWIETDKDDRMGAVERAVAPDQSVDERVSLQKSGPTWQYYYSNLSMIPDEETYEVHDVARGRSIGSLDEKFVINFAEPGAVFIQRGEMWRIAEVDADEGRVSVSPVEDPGGEVPSWVGEEIPVPYAIAQEVGEVRAIVGRAIRTDRPDDAIARQLQDDYPTDMASVRPVVDRIAKHIEAGHAMPTAEQWLIESGDGKIVINACLGHLANETLGRLLAALLGQETGSSIGLDIDPYRIELEVPARLDGHAVERVLRDTDAEHVEPLLELSLKRSDALKFKLTQVATKFGALKRWENTDPEQLSPGRLLGALEGTPVYEEALREVFHEDLDIERAKLVIEAIQSDAIQIAHSDERTPIGRGGRSSTSELLAPENADASVIQTVKERLQEDRMRLLCVHCLEFESVRTVETIADQPSCPNCGSTRIAAINAWNEEAATVLRSDEKDDDGHRIAQRTHRAANLVQSHGKEAIIALAARGVGPQTAARILGNLRETKTEFYRDILEQERQYARTKAFWD